MAHREHLDQLEERAAKLSRAVHDPARIADVGFEQFLVALAGVKKRAAQGGPQIAGADLRSQLAHLHRAPGPAAGQAFTLRHQLSCTIPTRLIKVAASAAPNPLSMFTTVPPLAQGLSIPSSAAIPPNAVP